ncbi:hypothetical protein AB0B04_18520 [Streptomyces xinghaiensis]|uniref:Uncharacterized protein n=2 Tax=Streptomyces TaxID=1883 RepID=A0A3R7EMV7_9ACTN|nr:MULTISPECIES: hypothetical protein [Streptomyces]KNE78681.1 hypothetical protein ADZ36_31860 [Streptomyces fradiae]OFA33941.1 hypothetical protein BEN35_32060 [Streptomyces fradiae]PQM20715.1 hypothetical protein Sfr7A_26420 [Streptomyces xinghaiensis]RKM92656.1 hypothetical protein SFRA_025075 [Streptomyces xinghaiensis]RNC70625.1 hypothetical protein DC095_026065 [Streptomyces xinghaiensis]
MSWIRPVANGLRTDHPMPGLPFINDERLPLDNPDAIERTGRNQGEGLWGRTDSLRDGGWVAFTTETKNRAYAWAVHQHPTHGRTVLLIRDQDMSSLHHEWMFGHNGFLYRHGGYWWGGTAWHRPGQVTDRAYERYDARPVEDAVTITAADLLPHPAEPGNARIAKIADFTAPKEPLPHWRAHLALWAASRRPGSLPLDRCVIDLRAPELDPARLVDRTGLAQIAGLALEDLPHPTHGRSSLPVPQTETAEGPRWSRPVARDWAEEHRRTHEPQALLSGTTAFGTEQPLGLIADHHRLTKIIRDSLQDADSRRHKRALRRGTTQHEETAAQLAWWPAVAVSTDIDGLIPVAALRTTLVEAVVAGLAEDVDRTSKKNRAGVSLGDIRTDIVKLLDWHILRKPAQTPVLFGEICLLARLRLGLEPRDVGELLRRSLHLDSELDGETLDALLDLALPPSAQQPEDH